MAGKSRMGQVREKGGGRGEGGGECNSEKKTGKLFRVRWAVPLPTEGGEEAEVLGENP
jgi:hypothetical protein